MWHHNLLSVPYVPFVGRKTTVHVTCRPQAQRAVAVAMLLSDLSASGVPVDAHSIAAAMVIDAVSQGQIPTHVLHRELGMQVRPTFIFLLLCPSLYGTHIITSLNHCLTARTMTASLEVLKHASTQHPAVKGRGFVSCSPTSSTTETLQDALLWCFHLTVESMQVCVLVHELQRVRAAPLSIQVYDEASSAAVREQCLTLCDVRAVLIEVVCRLDQLQNCQSAGVAKQQVLALQV